MSELFSFLQADAEHLPFPDGHFDLVFGSPPYCDARTYGSATWLSDFFGLDIPDPEVYRMKEEANA